MVPSLETNLPCAMKRLSVAALQKQWDSEARGRSFSGVQWSPGTGGKAWVKSLSRGFGFRNQKRSSAAPSDAPTCRISWD